MTSNATLGPADSLEVTQLIARYRNSNLSPRVVLAEVLRRVEKYGDPAVWISRVSEDDLFAQIDSSERRRSAGIDQPLFGIPFAVKDNIDVAGQPTTAACPAFRYVAERSATVVQRLCDAGAIVIGKTNLDQFATGLVGTRSPFGACKNVFDGQFISGGSSSGSAVAVAAGLVSFSLGTDTAGSGRVPAAFNNLVGLKPSCGRLSTAGVVPACRSLDCVSIFTHTCGGAELLLKIAEGFDPGDAYSKHVENFSVPTISGRFRFGVLAESDREFFGDAEAEYMYAASIEMLKSLGGEAVTIDFDPFTRAAELLYFGPWVAERSMVAKDLLQTNPEAILPITRGILESGLNITGLQVFEGLHKLAAIRQQAAVQLNLADFMLLPTTGTIYTTAQVLADPLRTNTNLGRYTNFVNLLDLCAVAIPAGFRSNKLPSGVTLIGPAGADEPLLRIADSLHKAIMSSQSNPTTPRRLQIAVVGAHLSGMPLNHQLTERGASLVCACNTAAVYRLFALPGTKPPKPGLIRVEGDKGVSIALEIWEMGAEAFADFIAAIPSPLGIGSIQMDDGSSVQGFVCESFALTHAVDISKYGGWRAYIAAQTNA